MQSVEGFKWLWNPIFLNSKDEDKNVDPYFSCWLEVFYPVILSNQLKSGKV